MGSKNRLNQIDEELRKEISNIISYKIKNPKITGLISVTKVDTTPDLSYARVFISILNGKNDQETIETLKSSAGFIRSEVASRVQLRYTPQLLFELDSSMEYGQHINKILRDIIPEEE